MRTVITYGVFDLFHEGHERLLTRARELGDRLIVGVTTEAYAEERGKLCTVDSLEKRLDAVRRCACVDEVIVEDHEGQKIEDIARYGVDVFAIGDDWFGKFDYLEPYCEVVYLKRTAGISSSSLRFGRYPELRMGIIGAGRIADRFMRESGYLREVRVTGVYHPSPDTSASMRRFLDTFTHVPKVRTTDKLFDLCDAVYIASPHGTHYAYAREAILAGRHVLCEKPLALKKREAEELFSLAEERGVVLMEAIKTAYCPGFRRLLAYVRSGAIGEVAGIESTFTKLVPADRREWTDPVCGGSFTELGSYVMLPIIKLLGTDGLTWSFHSAAARDVMPAAANISGADAWTRLTVSKDWRLGTGRCGIGVKSEGELVISGTTGYIVVQAPWWKTTSFEIRREDPYDRRRFDFEYAGDGLRYELADFMYRVQGYPGRDDRLRPAESVLMAEILEDFLDKRQRAEERAR